LRLVKATPARPPGVWQEDGVSSPALGVPLE